VCVVSKLCGAGVCVCVQGGVKVVAVQVDGRGLSACRWQVRQAVTQAKAGVCVAGRRAGGAVAGVW